MSGNSRRQNTAGNAATYGTVGGVLGAAIPGAAWAHYRATDYRNMLNLINSIEDKHVKIPGPRAKGVVRAGPDSVVGVTMVRPKVTPGFFLRPGNLFERKNTKLKELAGEGGRLANLVSRYPKLASLGIPWAALRDAPAYGYDEVLGSGSSMTGGTGARHGFGVGRGGADTYHAGTQVMDGGMDLRDVLKDPRSRDQAALTFKLKDGTPAEKKMVRAFMQAAAKGETYDGNAALTAGLRNVLFPYGKNRKTDPQICPPGSGHHCGSINKALSAIGKGGRGQLPGAIVNNKNLELDTVLLGGSKRKATAVEAKNILTNTLRASAKSRNKLSLGAAAIMASLGIGTGAAAGGIKGFFED